MFKFFVDQSQINGKEIRIIGDDVNHIKNVLRLGHNEKIEVCDIKNSVNYLCNIVQLNNKIVVCEILEELKVSNESKVYLHIFQGLPKAEKMETIIQKTTEIGVSEITPLIMSRCVVKLDEKASIKKNERWQKIAEVAAKQSKRDRIPKINLPIVLKKLYEKIEDYDIVLVAYENEKDVSIKDVLKTCSSKEKLKIAVIIGPEGGIEESEMQQLKDAHVLSVSLGKRILRTETAPIVLSSIIMYEFNEMI